MSNHPTILLLTHGNNCVELIKSTEMIYGPIEDVVAIPLLEGQDPDDYEAIVLKELEKHDDVFIMVDLKGGTPFNTYMKLGRTRALYAVTGVCVPMLMEALDSRGELHGQELADHVAQTGSESIVSIASYYVRTMNV